MIKQYQQQLAAMSINGGDVAQRPKRTAMAILY